MFERLKLRVMQVSLGQSAEDVFEVFDDVQVAYNDRVISTREYLFLVDRLSILLN